MAEIKKTYHHVATYLFNNTLYVVPWVERPPIFVWSAVNPVEKIQNFSKEKLADTIDAAKKVSKSHFDPAHANQEIKSWVGGESNQVWNHSTKLWSLWWNEDGSVDMDTQNPDKMYRGDMQWKTIFKKTFFPPISSSDIAKEILNQI